MTPDARLTLALEAVEAAKKCINLHRTMEDYHLHEPKDLQQLCAEHREAETRLLELVTQLEQSK